MRSRVNGLMKTSVDTLTLIQQLVGFGPGSEVNPLESIWLNGRL